MMTEVNVKVKQGWFEFALAIALSLVLVSVAGLAHAQEPVQDTLAYVRIVHASPDAPAIDVYVDGKRAFRNVRFKQVTGYAIAPAREIQIQVVPRGRSLRRGPIAIDTKLTFSPGKPYTIAVVGEPVKIKPLIFNDDWVAPGKGRAKVRFIQLSPGMSSVDVTLSENGNAKLALDVEVGEASNYVEIDAGTFDISVRPEGTTNELLGERVTFEQGRVHTIYAVGLASDKPALSVVTSEDAAAALSHVRLLHASPDASAMDVYVDGERVARRLRYRAISKSIELLPGEHQLQIVPAGKPLQQGTTVIDTKLAVESNKAYTVAVAGTLDKIKLIAITDSGQEAQPYRGLVRVWHLSPDAPAVDVTLPGNDNANLALDLQFGAATDYLGVRFGRYRASVRPAGTTDEVLAASFAVLEGSTNTLYIVGLENGRPRLSALTSRDR